MGWIYHQHKARVHYSLTTDRQSVIYWATNHMLARLYFDSKTHETEKKASVSFKCFQFPPLYEKRCCQER